MVRKTFILLNDIKLRNVKEESFMSKIYTLRPASLKVFLLIVRKVNTTISIAEALQLRNPTVSHHIKTLMEAGLIERGEKRGKFQPYRPRWLRVAEEFIKTVSHEYFLGEAMATLGREYKSKLPPVDVLAKNKHIQALVKSGIEDLAYSHMSVIRNLKINFRVYFKEFIMALLMEGLQPTGDESDKEFQTFKKFVESCRKPYLRFPGSLNWAKAMKGLGFKKAV